MNRGSELTFAETINAHINKLCSNDPTIIFGQNIISGSRISGLGKGLEGHSNSLAINTTNTENTLIGMGFGVLLTGVNAIYLMKQHDFGLLGFDQLRHTNNLVQNLRVVNNFRIIQVVVDSGMEGPQSNLNNLSEYSSISNAPVYFLNSLENIVFAFEQSKKDQLSVLAISQSTMRSQVSEISENSVRTDIGQLYFSASNHEQKLLLIAFATNSNFTIEIRSYLQDLGFGLDILLISHLEKYKLKETDILSKYQTIIVSDDSKSAVSFSDLLLQQLFRLFPEKKIIPLRNQRDKSWSTVDEDTPGWNFETIARLVGK